MVELHAICVCRLKSNETRKAAVDVRDKCGQHQPSVLITLRHPDAAGCLNTVHGYEHRTKTSSQVAEHAFCQYTELSVLRQSEPTPCADNIT